MTLNWLLPALMPAALLAANGPALAATVYECNLKGARLGEWVSPQIVILHDTEKKIAKVSDPVILHFVGVPLDADIVSDNGSQSVFGWTVAVTDGDGRSTRMSYRARWSKANKRLELSATSINSSQSNWMRTGTCSISQFKT